jgi:hydrogenase maturation protease
MTRNLIIAIGNVARGDDGAAHRVAALLGEAALPAETRILTATGLDVAMAADVADASRLIVVDALRRESPAVTVEALVAGTAAHSGHSIDGPGLLAVTEALYGVTPEAHVVAVAAPEMGHGEVLSATARAASEEAARIIVDMVREA